MKKSIWWWIWEISEDFHIPLGRFAPYVFSKKIGYKGKKT